MPTFYKPTEVRGKRVIYRSIDPDEAKRVRRSQLIAAVVILGIVALIHWLGRAR